MNDSKIKKIIKDKLILLIQEYKNKVGDKGSTLSEEMVRSWINELLLIFGWNVKDRDYVLQEKILDKDSKERLSEINSSHKKPDYTLKLYKNVKVFVDAKKTTVNIFEDKETAFQIRSYGWSSKLPCSFVTNFEQFVIYDCRFVPNINQSAKMGTIQLSINDYVDKFDILFDHLFIGNVLNGNLERIYENIAIEGESTLDNEFNAILSKFRLDLATEIYNCNSISDIELNYYVQVIMNRILFIRVCESRGLEKIETLKNMLNGNFWEEFSHESKIDYLTHYDGPIFSKEKKIDNLVIQNNDIFDNFIKQLYYPSPYKFDIIPTLVISNLYEDFLSREIVAIDGQITERLKDDYIKSNGAIPTPKYIVDGIIKSTFEDETITCIKDILSLKVLDPCCGSGSFMVSTLDYLEKTAVELYKNKKVEDDYKKWFIEYNGDVYLTIEAKREIITNVIYGIDYDLNAIEVSKVSLALKIIDDIPFEILDGVGAFDEYILESIQKNLLLGNTLISTDIDNLNTEELLLIRPIDILNSFEDVKQKGGFDFILGNPPYVETKNYKVTSLKMHNYLREKYNFFEGKADLSILFIERCLNLLNDSGKLNFIIQKRWFKTKYGSKIRKFINDNKMIDTIIDFETNSIFSNRITYISILKLSKKSLEQYKYVYLKDEPIALKYLFESNLIFCNNEFTICDSNDLDDTWSFDSNVLSKLIKEKKTECGSLGQLRDNGVYIKDGIQVLYKKIYHITHFTIDNNIIYGKNGLGEEVKIELDAVKPVIYNQNFYCCKKIKPSAYAIFPYEGENYRNKISFSEISRKWPLLYKYLSDHKDYIQNTVECNEGDYWHTYTREHNHESYNKNKIIIPMTAKDTIASIIYDYGCYMDNSNVWFITLDDDNILYIKSIAMIINSTPFSVFAKAKANPQQNGYNKFNKQFLIDVPFPMDLLKDEDMLKELSNYYDEIFELQERYIVSPGNLKSIIKDKLNNIWTCVDNISYKLYKLSDDEINIIENYGRTVNRVELIGDNDV